MSVEIFDEIFNAASIKKWLKSRIDQEFTAVLMKKLVQNIVSNVKIEEEYTRIIETGIKRFFLHRDLNIENKEILDSIDRIIMEKIRTNKNGVEKSMEIIKHSIRNSELLNDAILKEFKEFFNNLIETESQQHLLIPEFSLIFEQTIQSLTNEYSDIINKSFEDFVFKDEELRENIIKFFKIDVITRMAEKLKYQKQDSEIEELDEINRNIVSKLRRTLENDKDETLTDYGIIISNEMLLNNIEVSTFELIPESIKAFNIREFTNIFKDSKEEIVKKSISEHINIQTINNIFFKYIEEKLKSSKNIIDQTYRNIILDKYNRVLESNTDFRSHIEDFVYTMITGNNQISTILERIKNKIDYNLVKKLIPNKKFDIVINDNIIISYQNAIKETYKQAFREIIDQGLIKGVCYCSKCKNTIIYDLEENECKYEVLCRKCK